MKNIVNINGKTINIEGDYNTVSIKNGRIFLDGKEYKTEEFKNEKIINLVINGEVQNINRCTGDIIVNDGNVERLRMI